ncbi:MAG: 23S rRNA (pseudouridine(1915)-N(3))-methyltransferase RlmH [Robiginitomaculum sp.]|nr:23S rRNA (pseudouridine(1915)-N(3))-methyltransferase RlmH [Robiginitomaculum sp.]
MKLGLVVCGKLKSGPTSELVNDYLFRAKRLGRNLGISDVSCREITLRAAATKQQASEQALRAIPAAAKKVILDETGKNLSSAQFAKQLNSWREQGIPEITLLVGPADGWDEKARHSADLVLSFGKMTWPHKLAQVMAAEQIYRALSLLSGSPYHRGND